MKDVLLKVYAYLELIYRKCQQNALDASLSMLLARCK
jgi:hypothetical protein